MNRQELRDAFFNPKKSIYDPPEFNRSIALQVERELHAEFPENKWSDNYLVRVIESCCKGDSYFYGHHDAFRRYLEKLGLFKNWCDNCELTFFSKEPEDFCSMSCAEEYYS